MNVHASVQYVLPQSFGLLKNGTFGLLFSLLSDKNLKYLKKFAQLL